MQLLPKLLLLALLFSTQANATQTVIKDVQAIKNGDTYRFSVTLEHADKSWEHYANLWQVETEEGTILAKRVLLHPHINEQPFTRSLSGVSVPKGTKRLVVVAGCTVEGINSERYIINLP